MKYLLLLAMLVLIAHSAPAEDQVLFPIKDYNNHLWYSGKFIPLQQAISISTWAVFTMFTSNRKRTRIMTPLFYGSTEALAAPV